MGIVKLEPYKRTKEDQIAHNWCVNHGIKIGMLAVAPGFDNASWKIRVVANGKETISPRQVAKEAVRAMIIWFVIYLVLFIILLGYKWQTKTYYAENPNPSPITQSVVKNVIKTVKKTNKNDLSQHEKTLKATIKAYEKAAKGHQSELKELQETTKILHEYHDKIWALNLANEKPSSETMKLEIDTLKDLLETQTISSMEDPTPSFQKANKELEGLISNKDIVDWQAVKEIFQKEFPDKLASRNNVK